MPRRLSYFGELTLGSNNPFIKVRDRLARVLNLTPHIIFGLFSHKSPMNREFTIIDLTGLPV